MTDGLILPLSLHSRHEGLYRADDECTAIVNAWMTTRTESMREYWSQRSPKPIVHDALGHSSLAGSIADILTHRAFNHQSKYKSNPILPGIRIKLAEQVKKETPIKFLLLYNGGYRASSLDDSLSLIFEPDQTELMLLYQIALLKARIDELYPPGIDFRIVVNNGVAHWVNDISIRQTEGYARMLRRMIEVLGADGSVRVLLQSELEGYDPGFSFEPVQPIAEMSEQEHGIVERFLGRSCSLEEARYRTALYAVAEAKWAEDLSSDPSSTGAILMRQIAHPNMLSFRPFPGGAIRAQNGTLGFQYRRNVLTPKLITSETARRNVVKWVPYSFPW